MSNPKTERVSEIDPVQGMIADRLARVVIDCDPAILSLLVVDSFGRVLKVARSSRLPAGEEASAEQVKAFGTVAKMIVGAANQASPLAGATEVVIGIFKHEKILLMNIQEYNVVMGLRLSRSASAEYVGERIRGLLASTQ